ncbi:hypothetical protein EBZ38_14680 [bacterium]|nr:hypothetical protein [bacterium]NDC95884.1 hypothetical protein [bacterium]NDD85504.1 hypothetical protein [bacterium]
MLKQQYGGAGLGHWAQATGRWLCSLCAPQRGSCVMKRTGSSCVMKAVGSWDRCTALPPQWEHTGTQQVAEGGRAGACVLIGQSSCVVKAD